MLAHILNREVKRIPRILTLWAIFELFPYLGRAAHKMGLEPASARQGLELLRKNCMTILFPEGVSGSFKPSSQRYQLQTFRTGFVRLAVLSGAPVIPTIVIGAEESNINFGMIHFGKLMKGLAVPVPFNMIPFPAKWKIIFLPPVDLSAFRQEDTSNKEVMQSAADHVRLVMQNAIDAELKKRNYIYFGKSRITPMSSRDGSRSTHSNSFVARSGHADRRRSVRY
jgi:1-acyl-sn-glycerol-3-phosphate acyltransferase